MEMVTESQTNNIKTKKKILILIGTLAVGGGAEKVAATVGNELKKRGHDVHLLTFYEAKEKYDFQGSYSSLDERPKNRLDKAFLIPKHILKIRKYCLENNIETVFSFLEEANFQVLVTKKIFLPKLKAIVSVRNSPRSRGRLFQWWMRFLYPSADDVVTVTRAIEEMMREDFALKNLTTIYNPIDIELINNRLSESLPEEDKWLEEESELFIHVGRHTKQKGQWHLLRVFEEFVKTNPKAKLLMIGDGELTPQIRQFVTNNQLDKNIFLLGKRNNIFPYLKVSKAFLLTSLWEGMPNVLLEALASKLPIISTDCQTGPREIIAPELPLGLKVVYPYETPFGFLTETLSDTIDWQSVETDPLSGAEKQILSAINGLEEKANTKKALDTGLITFSLEQIVSKWEQKI